MISPDDVDSFVLPNLIDDNEKSVTQFTNGFIVGKFHIHGGKWVDKLEIKSWSPIQIGKFLIFLPFNSETWDRATFLLKENVSLYWNNANANPYEEKSYLNFAIEQLIKHHRPLAAIRCLDAIRNQNQPLEINLIVNSLNEVIGSKEKLTITDQYAIVELIKFLQNNPSTKPEDLFTIEWRYLPLLDIHFNASPTLLEQKLD